MAVNSMNRVMQRIRQVVVHADDAGETDADLLARFLSLSDSRAVGILIHRHCPMVWGVCWRILGHPQDAEDAFQATFVVLLRKANAIKPRNMVGNWLYGVALQTALKARAMTMKRSRRERPMATLPEPFGQAKGAHPMLAFLDEELGRLPDHYRTVLVSCDLQGKTRAEVAQELGCAEGTVGSRLARGRRLLARRLSRHGAVVSAAAISAVLANNVGSAAPVSVIAATVQAATKIVTAKTLVAAGLSQQVITLAEGVLKAMLLTKLKIVGSTLTIVVLASFGIGFAIQTYAGEGGAATAPNDVRFNDGGDDPQLERRSASPKNVPAREGEVRDVVDRFLKSVLAGETKVARALAAPVVSDQQLTRFKGLTKTLAIANMSVTAGPAPTSHGNNAGRAFVITDQVEIADGRGKTKGCVVLTLLKDDERLKTKGWVVWDIDFADDASIEKAKNFIDRTQGNDKPAPPDATVAEARPRFSVQLAQNQFHHQGQCAFLDDNRTLVRAGNSQHLDIRDAQTGMVLQTIRGQKQFASKFRVSPDGKWVAAMTPPDLTGTFIYPRLVAEITVWDSATWKVRGTVDSCRELLGIGPDGSTVAVLRNGQLEIWDVAAKKQLKAVPFSYRRFDAAALSPDGSLLVVSADNEISYWKWRTADQFDRLNVNRLVGALAFSPDGKLLAEASQTAPTIEVRELATMRVVKTLSDKHVTGDLQAMIFTEGGATLITATGGIDVWDMQQGRLRRQLTLGRGGSCSLAISPDGKSLGVVTHIPEEDTLSVLDIAPTANRKD